MSQPMFFFAGVYEDVADADADYESIKALHAGDFDEAEQEALAAMELSAKAG
ncbi:MAG: hypothetical protein ABW135_17840 [Thermoleophilaceae bacterium]